MPDSLRNGARQPTFIRISGGCGSAWAKKYYCQASATTRIRFATGATSATARGQLDNFYDVDRFLARARAGQHMVVGITSRAGSARVYVLRPNGKLLEGAPGGVDIAKLPVSGDYQIRIVESQMGEPWTDGYRLSLSIQ